METKFPAFVKKYYEAKDANRQTYLLQPLSEIHFDTEFSENPGTTSTNSSTLIVLAFIGAFILLVACVNFINLSTALSVHKSKEVGVRKTLGAQRHQLTWQYLSEAFLITLCAGIISVGIAEGIAPMVSNFLERDVQLNLLNNPQLILFLIAIIFVTALFSGFYPALVLSKFNPVKALKNRMSTDSRSPISVRKILVVGQFFIAQVLIICTLVVSSQLSFFRNSSLGFTKEAVITVSIPDNSATKLEAFRNRLETLNDIKGVSFSLGAPISTVILGRACILLIKVRRIDTQ
ncbi:MAG: FtsX-like permease family protein [Flammeovirgaceae bacterium]|nr:FtsX-like permease family protein [Flammeovirgaceae bacterium]